MGRTAAIAAFAITIFLVTALIGGLAFMFLDRLLFDLHEPWAVRAVTAAAGFAGAALGWMRWKYIFGEANGSAKPDTLGGWFADRGAGR
ncbi:MAG: hypothetical protein WEB00_04890 [Dehalococcoidia bacterium]